MPNNKLRYDHPGYTLVAHLFRQYLVDNDIDTEQAEKVTIRQFYEWVVADQGEPTVDSLFPDKSALQETYDISDEVFEDITGVFSNPFDACARLYTWWPLLTLAARKPLTNTVAAIALTVSVHFKDGLDAIFTMPLKPDLGPFTDGLVSTLWRGQLVQVGTLLRSKGLDAIHSEMSTGKLSTVVTHIDAVCSDDDSDI